MNTIVYQCPCCGASLSFDGASGKLKCTACGSEFDAEAMELMSSNPEESGIHFDMPAETFGEDDPAKAFTCKNCGAQLMTEETTTATECPYCGSPTVLPQRISGVKPEKVIPFVITKEQAQKSFEEYFKGKRLLPDVFSNSRNRIAEMRKLYVPYWLFDCDASASIVYDAQKRSTRREGDWEIERVEHFVVRRAGSMSFEEIPVDGSQKLDDRITESLEPYDLSAAVPFQMAVLAGAMADRADVDAEKSQGRAVERVEESIRSALRDTVNGYTSVTESSKSITAESGKATPVLMPVWLITTEKEGKVYTFAINGQTGKLTCDVPADRKKSWIWGGGVFAGVMGAGALALALLEKLASGTLLMLAVVAAVIALAVVGGLRSQLKQAVMQSSAANYVRKGSFKLHGRADRFLYATTNRRKIEPKKD